MTTASKLTWAVRLKRCPEFRAPAWSKLKPLWQDSDDGVGDITQRDRLADHVSPSAKSFLPSGIGQDHRGRCTDRIFSGIKIPAKHWSNAQCAEKSVAHTRSSHRLHTACSSEHVAAS